ncbi:hypothetical protein FQN50_007063 [Emmonsiellopsis sp. PD_5]|nr:hypothetical protein FQN50_007063 [Emmonsiellopsis sp. PD_5]
MLSIHATLLLYLALILPLVSSNTPNTNRTYTNPILPGWNSDPSCTFVKEWDDTFFCTTSSFLAFPGIPVFASKDLTNWRLASNALNRPEQLLELASNGEQMEGPWASTIRFRNGTFYLITAYVAFAEWEPKILLFTTTDPFDDAAWSDPLHVENPANDIDPDIFWDDDDDDGKVYMAIAAGIYISEIDVSTGKSSEPFKVWNGTGDRNPEGPHLYKKDGYYYLLIGEGGTETNHSVTIARSRNIRGPYEGYEGNPILTAKNTENYFQTVGHADLFQDAQGNWWAVALATRSGPDWEIYPMGRETVLVPVRWEEGEWPVLEPVFGRMSGPMPPECKEISGAGHGPIFQDSPDIVDFRPSSDLARHFMFWRPPKTSLFAISPPGHPNTLRISPSRVNLTADGAYEPAVDGLAFVARKQTSTLFNYSIDVSFTPTVVGEEAGISVFLTQLQHIDLGIVALPDDQANGDGSIVTSLRFRVEASGKPNITDIPETNILPLPKPWTNKPLRLSVSTLSDSEYVFSAALASKPHESKVIGAASAGIVSGGSGPFTGEPQYPI